MYTYARCQSTTTTLVFLLREHARKDFFSLFSNLLAPAGLLGFQEFCHARHNFNKENMHFSTLLALIGTCSFRKNS